MPLSTSSTRLWLVTATSLFAASALVGACGGEVGPADGDDSSMDATGGSFANASTGTSRSGSTLPKGRGGAGNNSAQAMGAAYSTAQGGAKAVVTGLPEPGTGTTVTVGQGGRSPREPGEPGPGKVGAAGTPSIVGPSPAQGGAVATSVAGPTCRNSVRDGDSCNPSYDLTECVVRTTRTCVCDPKKKVWACRAYDANTGGTASVGGQAAVAGSKSDTGGKHGGNEPVAGQPANHLAGASGH